MSISMCLCVCVCVCMLIKGDEEAGGIINRHENFQGDWRPAPAPISVFVCLCVYEDLFLGYFFQEQSWLVVCVCVCYR